MEEAEIPVGINAEAINRTAVVRDPYARWCGRRGAARPRGRGPRAEAGVGPRQVVAAIEKGLYS